jgi:uncharacterized protein YndB with AHSA1/START domain
MRKVEVTIFINVKPREIISAFMQKNKLKDWWQVEKTLIVPRQGGQYILAWNISSNGIGYVTSGKIEIYEPDNLLVIDNFIYLSTVKPFLGPMKLTIRATNKLRGSNLYLCQEGYKNSSAWNWYYEAVKKAWPKVLKNLKNYLEK